MYYLNSRYYDPETGRFINADDVSTLDITKIAINGLNLYAYCLNNPVNEVDESGMFLSWLLGLLIACIVVAIVNTAVQLVSDVVDYAITGQWTSGWEDYLGAFIGGFTGGAVFYLTGGNLSLTLGVMSGVETLSTGLLTNATGKTNYSISEILLKSIFTGVISGVIGAISGGTKQPGITIGRNNMFAVFKSGLTKLKSESVNRMSLKVFSKGLTSVFVLKSFGAIVNGITQGSLEWVKFLLFGDKNGIGYIK